MPLTPNRLAEIRQHLQLFNQDLGAIWRWWEEDIHPDILELLKELDDNDHG